MDYSLLLQIEKKGKIQSLKQVVKRISGQGSRNRVMSKDKKFIYHLGIIDYLQSWDLQKRGEKLLKSLKNPKVADGLSC